MELSEPALNCRLRPLGGREIGAKEIQLARVEYSLIQGGNMSYTKPQIIKLDAVKVIQGDEKGDIFGDGLSTVSAYQADE